jgi:group I intron endonuclease
MRKRVRVTGIYAFRCLLNNKRYIGSSINCLLRNKDHVRLLNENRHGNPYLQAAWNKYGAANFEFEILERCPSEVSLLDREQFWINELKTAKARYGFNCMYPVKQRNPSRHMSNAHKSYWANLSLKERRARTKHLRSAQQQALATQGKQSKQHRDLKSKIAKKHWRSPKLNGRRKKLRERFIGFQSNLAVRKKISDKAKARWLDPKYRERGLKQLAEACLKAAAFKTGTQPS